MARVCAGKVRTIDFFEYKTFRSDILHSFHKHNLFPPKGKVHGSLARAGKVRGQTPKVRLHIIAVCVYKFLVKKNYIFLSVASCFSLTSCFVVDPFRWTSRRRERKGPAGQREEFSTTGALSMLSRRLAKRKDQMPTHKFFNICYITEHSWWEENVIISLCTLVYIIYILQDEVWCNMDYNETVNHWEYLMVSVARMRFCKLQIKTFN